MVVVEYGSNGCCSAVKIARRESFVDTPIVTRGGVELIVQSEPWTKDLPKCKVARSEWDPSSRGYRCCDGIGLIGFVSIQIDGRDRICICNSRLQACLYVRCGSAVGMARAISVNAISVYSNVIHRRIPGELNLVIRKRLARQSSRNRWRHDIRRNGIP